MEKDIKTRRVLTEKTSEIVWIEINYNVNDEDMYYWYKNRLLYQIFKAKLIINHNMYEIVEEYEVDPMYEIVEEYEVDPSEESRDVFITDCKIV